MQKERTQYIKSILVPASRFNLYIVFLICQMLQLDLLGPSVI